MDNRYRFLIVSGLASVEALLWIVVIVAWLTVGLRRWVRIVALGSLVLVLVQTGVMSGFSAVLTYVGLFVALNLALGLWRLGKWRLARSTRYEPATGPPWPAHAESEVQAWTAELERLGFERTPDVVSSYEMAGDVHRTRVRFFRHPSESVVASFSATDRAAKTVARSLVTPLRSGGYMTTCDVATDSAVIPIESHYELLQGGTWVEMLTAHGSRVAALGGGQVVDDPVAVAQASRDAWIERIVGDGRARVDGELIALNARAIVGAQLRLWARWVS